MSQSSKVVSAEPGLVNPLALRIVRTAEVSSILRFAGVGTVVLSMFLFLVNGMHLANDESRFHSMLAMTGMLSVAGFMMSKMLGERKGSRAFFSLAVVSVPINFTVLGALLYGMFGLDKTAVNYPDLALWTANSVSSVITVGLLSSVFLLVVTFFAFSIMAKKHRGWLTLSLMLSCAMLLVPLRGAVVIVPICAAMVLALVWVIKRYSNNCVSLQTPSAHVAKVLLFLPVLIMLVRSFWLYGIDEYVALFVAIAIHMVLVHFSVKSAQLNLIKTAFVYTAFVFAVVSAVLLAIVLDSLKDLQNLELLFCFALLALASHMFWRLQHTRYGASVIVATTMMISSACLFNVMQTSEAHVIWLSSALLLLLLAVSVGQRVVPAIIISSVTLLLCLFLKLEIVVNWVTLAGWWSLALLGIVAIVAASLLERYGPAISVYWASIAKAKRVYTKQEL